MRKPIFISIMLLVTFYSTYSQIPVGLKYDCNGYAFNGYYDPLTYSPDKKISIVHNSDSYEVGYYYDSVGNKINGLIKFENEKIFFKKGNAEFRDKIKPEQIKNFVIGVDSFFVISNFYYKNRKMTDPEFVQYITAFNGLTFAKHYKFTSGVSQQITYQQPIIETLLVKAKDSTAWENFPDNSRFKESALKYFSHIPYLKEKINSGKYQSKDMLSIIKMAEYYDKYQNSNDIYYDKYWQEVIDIRNSKYSAKIIDLQDSIWTFAYYEGTVKLFIANYSSFYPNNKNGDFISYYPNGEIRQIITFENNQPKHVKTFDNSGSKKRQYEYVKTKDSNSNEFILNSFYLAVIDSLGNNIIDSGVVKNFKITDIISQVSYFVSFNDSELISSYRINNEDTVFQITNPDNDFKIKSLQREFESFMYEKKYDNALSVNAQGSVLISFVIDKKGNVVNSTILNVIHPEIDTLISDFITSRFIPGALYPFKFKPYNLNKTKQCIEVVIPIEFSVNRFYREPVNYNQFNNMYWMNQQQMMNKYMNPTPPKMQMKF
jgi:hypothetical protein